MFEFNELFEFDELFDNILEYISLLHTELIGINKSLENLKVVRKDITRIADCAEAFFKTMKSSSVGAVPEQVVTKSSSGEKEKKKKKEV